jgi:transposase
MPRQTQRDQTRNVGDDVVLGVDTHKQTHTAAVITLLGSLLATATFPTTAAGYRELVAWARGFGTLRRAGVEGTGSYGATLTRSLRSEHVDVIEVNQPDKATRRRRGKTDAIDAESAARAVLSGRATAAAKAGDGPVEMMRMFKLAKASAVKARTQTVNQLKAVLVGADPTLREAMTGLGNASLVRRCAALDTATPDGVRSAAAYTLRLLARRILALNVEVSDLDQRITAAVTACTPKLLDRPGIGPDNAAALLITVGDNPERLRSEGSFASLCGVSPVEASSGQRERQRLNRGGDRDANAALYRTALSRLRWDPATRDYMRRRISEGKTRREVVRCLKRYIAREVHQIIVGSTPDTTARPAAA